MTELNNPQHDFQKIERVRAGQKLIILAIVLSCIAPGFVYGHRPAFILVGWMIYMTAIVLGLVGIALMSSGLGYGAGSCVVFCLLMFIPLVSLIMLVVLNGKATTKLRANGYKVGLLGASSKRKREP